MLTNRRTVTTTEAAPRAASLAGNPAVSSTDRLAECLAARSLINAFLRENDEAAESPCRLAEAAETGASVPIAIRLRDGAQIQGTIAYASLTGQHLFEDGWILERGDCTRPLPFNELAETLVRELALRFAPEGAPAADATLKRIQCSVRNLRGHLERRAADGKAGMNVRKLDYIASEQSVFAGHPFHPYPKSVEGMNEPDLNRFSPERGAGFPLHYFAVRVSEQLGEWLPGERMQTLPPTVREPYLRALTERLGPRAETVYEPLPMHPWQAERLPKQPWAGRALARGDLVPLGPLGPRVYPTSSVRTVWEPQSGCGWKLPLDVRITNLIRVNTAEQTARTMHAARLAMHLGAELKRELPGLLPETGYAGIAAPDRTQPNPAFTVLFRPMAFDPSATFVLASLLESWPDERTPKIAQAIAENARTCGALQLPDMREWLERYLHLSMLPLLRVWDRFGISFEAHAQNSLLSLENGWPSRFYTRDLEGMSVDRRVAEAAGWIGGLLPEDSPLLYDAAKAWHRTQYYFFVNHLGALIHALALWQGRPEREGWDVVRSLLLEERRRAGERLRPYVDGLLNQKTLPAKANFASCLADKGDTPMYVPIANPIRGGRP
ncbi:MULTISPECIES: IucA/IucC family protein [Paenibacillus]|uniref:IucA/IucC family protein n=1 Tax=Paenibacillus TaxID=44249 RepID=UPI002FE25C04